MQIWVGCSPCQKLERCSYCEEIVDLGKLQISGVSAAVHVKPGCEWCKRSRETLYEKILGHHERIRDLEKTVEDLQKTVEDQRKSICKLNDRVAFLKPSVESKPSCSLLKGEVTIVVAERSRFILADKSPVLCRMLEAGRTSFTMNEPVFIQIPDTTIPVMHAVIDFCATADIAFSSDVQPDDVLEFAHTYDIPYLREVCGEEYLNTITKDNFVETVTVASKFKLENMLTDLAIKLDLPVP